MKRVVHAVRSDSFAGVERYICDVSAELWRRGWQVSVVGGDVDAMRASLPSEVHHHAAASTLAVVGQLALQRPPLLHVHMTAAEAAALISRPVTRAKVVSTRHFAAPRGRRPLVRALGGALSLGLSRELAISEFVSARAGGGATVLLNGVPDCDLGRSPDTRNILVMQRLQPEKDTDTALVAFARSGLAQAGWRLTIAGRGVLHDALRQRAEMLGVERHVDLVGFVREPEQLRSTAAVFLATAPAEPFGLSVVEAMARGLPIVAADGGAHPEVLGGTGMLFPPGDAEACATALRALAGSRDLRQRLGEAARARQRALLSLGKHVDQLEAVYAQVLA